MPKITRRDFVTHTAATSAALWAATHPATAAAKTKGLGAVYDEIERRHDETVARLQAWIKQPSISAENIGMDEGAEMMKQLALDAGFQHAEIVPTKGHPSVFATLDAGAKHTLGLYFMYDVKQADPAEWSSPPWDAKLLDMPGKGTVLMGRGGDQPEGPAGRFPRRDARDPRRRQEDPGQPRARRGRRGGGRLAELHAGLPRHAARARRAREVRRHLHAEPLAGKRRQRHHHPRLQGRHRVRPRRDRREMGPRRRRATCTRASPPRSTSRPGISCRRSTRSSRPNGDPAIDGFFEHVRPVSAEERAMIDIMAQAHGREVRAWKTSAPRSGHATPTGASRSRTTCRGRRVTIEGLVGGYGGPGGKTILPHKMTAKLDMRLVPDMTPEDIMAEAARAPRQARLRRHRDHQATAASTTSHRRRPTAKLIQVERRVYQSYGIDPMMQPRSGGSWPGSVFTDAPLKLPAGHFGLGFGERAHAPDEYCLIESTNPEAARDERPGAVVRGLPVRAGELKGTLPSRGDRHL